MTERRPHWSDDLIVAVGDAIEHADPTVYPTVGMVNDVIAAVEDWQVQHARNRVMLVTGNPGTYVGDLEAAIQRVREVVEHDGYTVTLPTANWNTQLESVDDPYRAEVVLSSDILEALEVPNE